LATTPYVFKATPEFWKAFGKLSGPQQEAAEETFKIFKNDPFDARLKTHRINRLSSLYRSTVMSVTIENDLRAVFTIKGNQIISLDIGTHEIYK
jgi:mRNA-degrading endonuclease YafQ of YafQ-DinJ toxin-antitoxin module